MLNVAIKHTAWSNRLKAVSGVYEVCKQTEGHNNEYSSIVRETQ